MNIFYTSSNPYLCAKYLDDKRVIKMVLETTQILCTVLNEKGYKTSYKSTHKHHPCVKWANNSAANFSWLLKHGFALCMEYKHRYNKKHKCQSIIQCLMWHFINSDKFNETLAFLEPPNCTIYKDLPITQAYRRYLGYKWRNDKRKPTWYRKNRIQK